VGHGFGLLVRLGTVTASTRFRRRLPDEFRGCGAGRASWSTCTTTLVRRHDLAARQPDVVAELRTLLRRVREQGHSAPRLG